MREIDLDVITTGVFVITDFTISLTFLPLKFTGASFFRLGEIMLIVEIDPSATRFIMCLNNGVMPPVKPHAAGGRHQLFLVMEPNKENRVIDDVEFEQLKRAKKVEFTQRRFYYTEGN